MIFEPHSDKQDSVVYSDRRIVIAGTGIQWGKTLSGVVWLKTMMHQFTESDDTFIITSPTYPILNQSTLPPFLKVMEGYGDYKKQSQEFHIHNGGIVYIRTGKNPDSIVGITKVRAILCDEAGLYSLYFWENILGRSSFMKAPIRIVTSPYSQNWLFKDFIRPIMRDSNSRPNVHLVQARSNENPYFPKDEYEERKNTMDPRRFKMMYGAEWGQMEGLVYDCFCEDENQTEPLLIGSDWRVVAGIDWGHTHPFVCTTRAIAPNGNHFQISEFVKSGLTISNIIDFCKSSMSVNGTERFYCGPDRPENIAELNRSGIPASPAVNDVKLGIDVHYELIKTRRYKIFKNTSPHTIDEYSMYHWAKPEDLAPDQDGKDRNPVKQHDDCMDANRYCSIMTYKRNSEKRVPTVPGEIKGETRSQVLKRLKRKPQHF